MYRRGENARTCGRTKRDRDRDREKGRARGGIEDGRRAANPEVGCVSFLSPSPCTVHYMYMYALCNASASRTGTLLSKRDVTDRTFHRTLTAHSWCPFSRAIARQNSVKAHYQPARRKRCFFDYDNWTQTQRAMLHRFCYCRIFSRARRRGMSRYTRNEIMMRYIYIYFFLHVCCIYTSIQEKISYTANSLQYS